MNSVARRHALFGLLFAIAGILLGIIMASSKNHTQHVTHAHIMLLGMVMSTLYAYLFSAWISSVPALAANLQFLLHQLGTLVIVVGLYLMYGNLAAETIVGPMLGIASIAVLLALIAMLYFFLRYPRQD